MRGRLIPVLVLLGIARVCLGQGPESDQGRGCAASIADDAGYQILRVTPNVRWGSQLAADGPVKPGDSYSQANQDLARTFVEKHLRAQDDAVVAELTRASVRYVMPCAIVESAATCHAALGTDKCVTLRIDAYAVQIPSAEVTGLNMGQSRSPTDTYLNGVPAPLLALSPRADLRTDAALGTTVRFSSETDLAQLVAAFHRVSPTDRRLARRFLGQVSLSGWRSTNADYYNGSLGFQGALLLHGAVKQVTAEFLYDANLRPLGEAGLRSNDLTAGASAAILTGWPVVRTLQVRGSYHHSAEDLSELSTQTEENTGGSGLHEQGVVAQVATDGTLGAATVRSSVWFERESSLANHSYRKVVARAGVERAIALRAHETVDLQLLGGYGLADGLVPGMDRFTGGNAGASFMDEKLDSTEFEALPAGPIARSFGAGKLDWLGDESTYGQQSFGHVNVTAGIPVGLSRPLIPKIQLTPKTTVAGALKVQVNDNHVLESSLIAQGHSAADAKREQARMTNAVKPAVNYIADQANLWSVKPVVLFDWARVRADSEAARSRLGVGGGVQFGLVTTQLQAAYIHSVGDGPAVGNFVFRLSFQNLF